MSKSMFLVLSIVCLFLVSCSHIPAGFSASTSPITGSYKVMGHGSGSASYFSLFNLIPFGAPNYNKAISEAIDEKGGDNLINARAYYSSTWLYIGVIYSLNVEGDVIKTESGSAN